MNEKLLADRITAIANPVDDSDWLDVRRRVRPSTRRRRGSFALAAVLCGTLVLAGAAFGLGYALFDLSLGDPAPERVQESFDLMDEFRLMAARSIGQEARADLQTGPARLVGRLRARNGRRVLFWAAPTKRGWCYSLQFISFRNPNDAFAQGGCGRGSFRFDSHSFVGGALFAGRVQRTVVTLEVFAGSERRRVQVTKGFYLFDTREGAPVRIVGRDSKGRVVFVRSEAA
jgi:hypothetical protein